jgi:hypothetical protein
MFWIIARLILLRRRAVTPVNDHCLSSCPTQLILTGKSSSDLWQNTNVAFLCEEIVNGMMAANGFQGTTDSPQNMPSIKQQDLQFHPVDIILDFEYRDWNYRIQSGNGRQQL